VPLSEVYFDRQLLPACKDVRYHDQPFAPGARPSAGCLRLFDPRFAFGRGEDIISVFIIEFVVAFIEWL
jgi:hypothetical protein